MPDQKIIDIIKEYINELSSKGINISKAYFYGSQARGSAASESDIDLALISPLFDEDADKYAPAVWLSSIRTENRIEPLMIGEKRFLTDDGSPIIAVVREEGIEIAA